MRFFAHDPQEVLDYGIEWTLEDGETLVSSSWAALPADTVELSQDSFNAEGLTVVWVTFVGATVPITVTVTNHIVTSDGRERDFSIVLKIRSK